MRIGFQEIRSLGSEPHAEWHIRYGGLGVIIYWHVERKSVCIYFQLKRCSSFEVAAMIEGVLRHNSVMDVQKNYTDSHCQSEVGFAFCHLLGFDLLPRLNAITSQKLYLPEAGLEYTNLYGILTSVAEKLEAAEVSNGRLLGIES